MAAILAITLTWQPAMDLFKFGQLHLNDLGASLLGGVAILVILEIAKRWWRPAFAS